MNNLSLPLSVLGGAALIIGGINAAASAMVFGGMVVGGVLLLEGIDWIGRIQDRNKVGVVREVEEGRELEEGRSRGVGVDLTSGAQEVPAALRPISEAQEQLPSSLDSSVQDLLRVDAPNAQRIAVRPTHMPPMANGQLLQKGEGAIKGSIGKSTL